MAGTPPRTDARPWTRRQWWSRLRPSVAVLDVLVGAGVAAALALLTPVARVYQAGAAPLDPLGQGLLTVTGLSLMARRRWPLATYLVGVGAAVT